MSIRPGRGRVVIKVRPRPARTNSAIVRLDKSEIFEGGDVLAIGPECHGVEVGDLAIFHRGHLLVGTKAHSLRRKLKDLTEEEIMILQWFDIFFVVEPGPGVELDGVLWRR